MPQQRPATSTAPSAPPADELDPESLRRSAFWAPKTIEQLAAEQGVRLPQNVDALVGQGADLWESDEELERFLSGVAERRRRDAAPVP
jgi:hypothetical protein